jgi:hypothetical protein
MGANDISRWTGHTPMSDPADHAPPLMSLPSDIGALNRVIQGVLVHSAWLAEYGLDEKLLQAGSRETFPSSTEMRGLCTFPARLIEEQLARAAILL